MLGRLCRGAVLGRLRWGAVLGRLCWPGCAPESLLTAEQEKEPVVE